MIDVPAGDSVASPTPTAIRAANSSAKLVARPEAKLAADQKMTPPITTHLRLRLSASQASGSAINE